MANQTLNALAQRRSIYALKSESTISDQQIEQLVKEAVKLTPSAFNSQSARTVVLLGEQHNKLWDITTNVLKDIVPEDNFSSTQQKMDAFKGAYGTVLFFEDQAVVEHLQANFELYKDNFPVWSEQSNGMLQLVIWTALAEEGLGASLQHYNPLIDAKVKAEWNIPASWKLTAQMPFGAIAAPAGEKESQPIDDRVKVYK